MKKPMKLFLTALALIIFAAFNPVKASASKRNHHHHHYRRHRGVIDLGNLSVKGEVRRPSLTWIGSQKRVKEMLPKLYHQEFKAIEAKLLGKESAHASH